MNSRKITRISLLGAILLPALLAAETPRFTVGVNSHAMETRRGNFLQDPELMHQLGVTSNREVIYWAEVERKAGEIVIPAELDGYVADCLRRGIEPMVSLCYGNINYATPEQRKASDDHADWRPSDPASVEAFCRYAEAVVNRFKGKIKCYEIWNEWGGIGRIKGTKGSAKAYATLLEKVVPRLKVIDPELTVIGGFVDGSWAGWGWYLDEFLAAGGLTHLDGYVSHLYVFNWGGKQSLPEAGVAKLAALADKLAAANGGTRFPIYVTESSYSTDITGGNGKSHAEVAALLARFYLLARTVPEVRGIWWYGLHDYSWTNLGDTSYHMGLLRPDGTPKQAFYAMASIARIAGSGTLIEETLAGKDVKLLKFKMPDNSEVWALWSLSGEADRQVILTRDHGRYGDVLTVEPAGFAPLQIPWGYSEWATRHVWHAGEATPRPELLSIIAGNNPILLRGDLSGVRVKEVVDRPYPESKRNAGKVWTPAMMAQARPGCPNAADFKQPNRAIPITAWFGMDERKPSGPADLSALLLFGYDEKNLYVALRIRDDKLEMPGAGDSMWSADSLQLAFRPVSKDGKPRPAVELDVALTPDGAKIYRRSELGASLPGLISDREASAKIKRDGEFTTYLLTLPAVNYGFPALEPGDYMAFSILVNDNDGDGRKGYLEWGSGIGASKDPNLYNGVIFGRP